MNRRYFLALASTLVVSLPATALSAISAPITHVEFEWPNGERTISEMPKHGFMEYVADPGRTRFRTMRSGIFSDWKSEVGTQFRLRRINA